MRPVRYIFLNKGLGMSAGKCAAQAAHAEMLAMHGIFNIVPINEVEADWTVAQEKLYDEWYGSGHYTKLVMEASDETNLDNIQLYLKTRGYRTYLVIDEGRTEIAPFTKTALAVELVDKDDERVQQHFSEFRTYKDRKPKEKKKWPRK